MTIPKTIAAELIGLFIDDGSLAAAVIAWIVVSALALHIGLIGPRAAAIALGVGLAALLAENVRRAARR
jgi:hypothetical protein